jgi:hypothetical protein
MTEPDRTDRADRCVYQLDSAAFMMGGLSSEENQSFAAHLVDCDRCNADIAEMLPVLAILESSLASGTHRAEDAPSSSLRQHVVAAVGRAGSDAVLASVRELRPNLASVPSSQSSKNSGSASPRSTVHVGGFDVAALSAPDEGTPASIAGLSQPRRLDRRYLAMAAAALLVIGLTVAKTVQKGDSPGTSYQLVALQKDPLRASAKINTKNDTTVAEFVVNGTVPDEIYFAWFEDPEGKRIGLGSFRGAAGPVRFRGQTGVPRANIVAVGASTKAGDQPTDRIRAELPKKAK